MRRPRDLNVRMRPLNGGEAGGSDPNDDVGADARTSEPRPIAPSQPRYPASDPRVARALHPISGQPVSRPRRQIWDLEGDGEDPDMDAQTAAYAAEHQRMSEPRAITQPPAAPRRAPSSEPLVLRNPVAPPSQPRYAQPQQPPPHPQSQPQQSYTNPFDTGYNDARGPGYPQQPAHSQSQPNPAPAGGPMKTRILGFHANAAQTDALAQDGAVANGSGPRFPAGWLVVVEGPGLGAFFAVTTSVSNIGRGSDQDICLDFGDTSISRQNHAAVAYDAEQNRFFLGHGNKSNVVRRNNQPVLSTEELQGGDLIRIGKTTLRFVALCGDDFTWPAEALADAEGGHYG